MKRDDDNLSLVRRVYERWQDSKGADIDCWLELMADEVELRSVGDGVAGLEFSSPRRSHREVREYLTGLVKDWQMLDYSVNELIDSGNRVVMLGHVKWRHRGTGKTFSSPKADFIEMRDGRIVGFIEFFDTAKAIAAASFT